MRAAFVVSKTAVDCQPPYRGGFPGHSVPGMDWVATLSAKCDDHGDFDHLVDIEADDWTEAVAAALLMAAPDWMVMDVSRVLSAEDQQFG